MPRDLKPTQQNKLIIHDAISGSDVELWYRMPTTQEMVAYQARAIRREAGRIKNRTVETRLEFGRRILTGFRYGDFTFDGAPISCSGGTGYREDWAELIATAAPDLIQALAFTVFEGALAAGGGEAVEFDVPEGSSGGGGPKNASQGQSGDDVPFS